LTATLHVNLHDCCCSESKPFTLRIGISKLVIVLLYVLAYCHEKIMVLYILS